MTKALMAKTAILDFDHPQIEQLIRDKKWRTLSVFDRIGAIYHFVKDEILFGYNRSDDIKASEVLKDGYGQCNTKSTLFMALLRGSGIPCRFHGFTIDKALQKGALPLWAHVMAPQSIIHSWVEVLYQDKWIELEGLILDQPYLNAIQQKFSGNDSFCGFGIATRCLSSPEVEWQGRNTYIQKEGINQDFGLYDHPDDFYAQHGTNLTGVKRMLYQNVLRHAINRHVEKLRKTTRDKSIVYT